MGAPPIVAREHAPTLKAGETPPKVSVDRAIAAAKEKFPNLEPGLIQLPFNAYSHVTIWGRGAYPLIFEQAAVNPYTYRVEWTRRVSDRSALERVTESRRPLHVGDFVGLTLKLVYFLFGVMLTTMSLTGMLIWSKRTAQATVAAVRKRPFPEPFPEPAE